MSERTMLVRLVLEKPSSKDSISTKSNTHTEDTAHHEAFQPPKRHLALALGGISCIDTVGSLILSDEKCQ
jgi:hypothetical protein